MCQAVACPLDKRLTDDFGMLSYKADGGFDEEMLFEAMHSQRPNTD